MAACSGSKTTNPNHDEVAAGKQLYQSSCASCHGLDGVGGKNIEGTTATNIRYDALNDMYKGDWSLAKRAILDGKDEEGEDLAAIMPRWRNLLSDAEVDDIIAYLQTLR